MAKLSARERELTLERDYWKKRVTLAEHTASQAMRNAERERSRAESIQGEVSDRLIRASDECYNLYSSAAGCCVP